MKTVIGMRIFKTALAVGFCVFLSQIFRLEYPFYAAIAAIISLESSLTTSFKAGRNRLFGTLVGALVGLLFASIAPNNAILCGLGIIVIISILNRFNWNSAISIAGIVFIAIMVNLNGHNPFLYGMNRMIDTAIGIIVALMVNFLIFPRRFDIEFKNQIEQIKKQLLNKIQEVLIKHHPVETLDLEEKINKLSQTVQLHASDLNLHKNQQIRIEQLKREIVDLKNIIIHLVFLSEFSSNLPLSPQNSRQLGLLFPDETLISPPDEQNYDPVYNHHVTRILEKTRAMIQPE
ncbi:MAG: aromatic acid exporter family protein [Anaerolineae bacterium]|nr:aromatic acid exporter family protein [Anaerolineae bacterium]